MMNDVTDLINQWLDHAKTLKKCAKSTENIFDHLKTDEVLLVYRTYLFVKRSFWLNVQTRQIMMQKLLNSIRTKICVLFMLLHGY